MKIEKLKWEYCECGCHQIEASIPNLGSWSIFIYLKDAYGNETETCRLAIPSHSWIWKYYPTVQDAKDAALADANEKMETLLENI